MNIKKYITSNLLTIIAINLCIFFALAGSLVSLHRYWQYETFFYDFGIFDQAIWKVAHFSPPTIDHLVIGGKWIFADHFNPSIFLLSPIYWLTDKREALLIAQASMVGASGFVLYLVGTHVLKNRFRALSVLVCYFLFVGLQNAVITDFHEVTIAVLPFLLTFLALVKKRYKLFFVLLILTLGFKESNFLLGLGLGIAAFLLDRKQWKIALVTCAISFAWGYISMHVIIPYFSGGIYQYAVDIEYNPVTIFGTFVNNPTKVNTIFYSFFSFGFLPILAYQFWALIFQDFLTRFYSPNWATRWDLGLHYSALLAAIFGIASIYSFQILQKLITKKIILDLIAVVLILNAIFLYRFILRGPFALSYNPAFYENTKNFEFLDRVVSVVPPSSSVMAQNNLAVRFDHQPMWVLQSDASKSTAEYYTLKKPEYIVLDVRDGQNQNNLFLIKDAQALLQVLKKDTRYEVIYNEGAQYIFKRK